MQLSNLMKKKGFNQHKLADESGVSQAQISRLLSGKMQPTLPTLQKLAAALNVSIAELLGDETCATIERQAG